MDKLWVTEWLTVQDQLTVWVLQHWLLAHWLTDFLIDCLANWLILADWPNDWLNEWLTDWPTGWLKDRLTDDWLKPTKWLIGQVTDWLINWLNDQMTNHLSDWLPAWLIV